MIPATASATPAKREVAGPAPGGRPQPADDEDRRGVLQQQGDADRQVRDGVVVAELRPGDGDQSVGDHRL